MNFDGKNRPVVRSSFCEYSGAVKLVKNQLNGNDRVVLKDDATADDLRIEAARLRMKFGYDIQPDGGPDKYVATHKYYRGRYMLSLEPD